MKKTKIQLLIMTICLVFLFTSYGGIVSAAEFYNIDSYTDELAKDIVYYLKHGGLPPKPQGYERSIPYVPPYEKLPKVKFKVNDILLSCEPSAVIWSDTTYVPLGPLAQAIGAEVTWDDIKKVATLSKDNKVLYCVVYDAPSYIVYKNANLSGKDYDESSMTQKPPIILKNRVMIPAKLASEAFKFPIEWDGTTSTVTINPNITINVDPPMNEEQAINAVIQKIGFAEHRSTFSVVNIVPPEGIFYLPECVIVMHDIDISRDYYVVKRNEIIDRWSVTKSNEEVKAALKAAMDRQKK